MAKAARTILLVKPRPNPDEDDDGYGFFGGSVGPGEDSDAPPDLVPLGTYREVVRQLADYNTASDGSPESLGLLYGPGLTVELPMVEPNQDVNQIAISLTEEDTAWPVLVRICRRLKWKMMDPATGRQFG